MGKLPGIPEIPIAELEAQLAASQQETRAAVKCIEAVDGLLDADAKWFDAQAQEWGNSMERFRGEPGEEHRFRMTLHIRDAY
ncbi:hypothetical protein SDC9_114467 [bioreactor metagenome]|uniref:Uncharacterized protein n=1 Tax=bioreactor metagenome TaxID=1076179 RepID=A0A645C0P8_9ZZZZ